MKINEIYKEYMIECETNCKKSTIDRYRYVFDLYILPYFGNKEIKKISVKDINLWKIEINKRKLYSSTKKKIYFNFSSLLNYGFRVYDIPNILHRCKGFKNLDPTIEYNIYSFSDFKKFDKVINNLEYKLFFNILFYLGLRRGEALALTYSDFKSNTLEINKSKRKNVISSPKTRYSFRIIEVPLIIINLLNQLKIQKKIIPKKNEPVFTFSESSLARYNIIYAKKANLKIIKIHEFRHSNISFLCSLGFTPQAIAKRVGHKNTKEIIETYLHSYQDELIKINDKLNELTV